MDSKRRTYTPQVMGLPKIWQIASRNNKRSLSLILFLLLSFISFGSILEDTLYINNGTQSYLTGDYHYLSFNRSNNDTIRNDFIRINADTLRLTVYNNDSINHTPILEKLSISGPLILPGQNATFDLDLAGISGTFILTCTDSRAQLLGASTIILKGFDGYDDYNFWNLYDTEGGLDTLVLDGLIQNIPISGYRPDFFTMNANHYPNVQNDTAVQVFNNVGDSIIIAIANTGKMNHSLHFHGYHVLFLDHSEDPSKINWIKDSFNISPGETVTCLLVPDKEGDYPVHDHNLIAVNFGGYPGGMITILNIAP